MMTSQTNPINIPSARNSASPRDRDSHVQVNVDDDGFGQATPMSYTPAPGAIPITSVRAPRRESLAGGGAAGGGGGGSLMTGISWGPGSVSSFLGKDDIAMQGSSPYIGHDDLRSPEFMESYMPRLEETYMTGFKCCDITLDTMHELLRHFEEKHAGESAFAQTLPFTSPAPDAMLKKPVPTPGAQVQPQDTLQRPGLAPSRAQHATPATTQPGIGLSGQAHLSANNTATAPPLTTLPELENLEDLDMEGLGAELAGADPLLDLSAGVTAANQQPLSGPSTPSLGQPKLSVNPTQYRFNQNIRSQPQTPLSGRSMYGANPTVSSVNTPSLIGNPLQALQRDSPQSSIPGTPAEPDPDMMTAFSGFGFNPALVQSQLSQYSRLNMNHADIDTIDDPGTRLTSPGNPKQSDTQDEVHQKLGLTQYGPDSEIAQTIRQRQADAGMQMQEHPYLCPVIGCSKGYKNSNGLRYHKQHGHKSQRLADNGDGTYSICDENGTPYEGTEGMAKAKPFACKVCGRRYKNANGLKYHYMHSDGCKMEGAQTNINDSANVAGAGVVSQEGS